MTTTITVNCGCGFRVTSEAVSRGALGLACDAIMQGKEHARETGHTMEVLGYIEP